MTSRTDITRSDYAPDIGGLLMMAIAHVPYIAIGFYLWRHEATPAWMAAGMVALLFSPALGFEVWFRAKLQRRRRLPLECTYILSIAINYAYIGACYFNVH